MNLQEWLDLSPEEQKDKWDELSDALKDQIRPALKNLPSPGPIPGADIPDWIINLNLSMQTSHIIHNGEIHSFSELCSLSDDVLMRIRNMGSKSLKEIKNVCEVERHKWPTWMKEMAAPRPGKEETWSMNLQEWKDLSPEEQESLWQKAFHDPKGPEAETIRHLASTDGPGETRRQGCSLSHQLEKLVDEEYKDAGNYYELSEKLGQIGADQEGGIISKLKDDELLHFFVLKGIVEHLDERYGCHR